MVGQPILRQSLEQFQKSQRELNYAVVTMVTTLVIACPCALGLATVANANRARYIERTSDISPLSRYVATPTDAGGKASSSPDKNLLFLLEGFGSSLGAHAPFSAR